MFDQLALREIIERGGVPFREGAVSFIFSCPRCSKDRKLYIRKRDGRFCCFVCKESDNFQGKPEYALTEIYSYPLEQIKEKLYGNREENLNKYLDLKLEDPFDSEAESFNEESFDLAEVQFPKNYTGMLPPGREYLINRGLTDFHIKEYGIVYHPEWKCVVFPVYVDGLLVGWQERSTVNSFKYTLKGFKKERVLMFQDRLKGSPHAVLCEGPVDGIKAHLCGGNVVSMGKGVSDFQLEILRESVKKIYLALDPDAGEQIDKICRSLYDDMDIFLLFPPRGRKDLGECSFEEVFEQFQKAQKYCGQMFL